MYQRSESPLHTSRLIKGTPFFYGWLILGVGTLGLIMTSPGQTYAISIFIEHFIVDLGVSRSLVSTLYAGGTLAGSLALPAVGRAIDRRGPRFMVAAIAVAFGLACILMGFVQGPLMLGMGFLAVRLFGQGSLMLVCQNVINQWWVNRRGMVMGISGLVLSLLGVGGFPLLINWLIPLYGWRVTYMLLGGLLLLVMAPLGYLFFRERPELYGLQPDGVIPATALAQTVTPPTAEQNWTLAEARRTAAFWIIAVSSATLAMLATGLFFHMVSIFADNQLSATVAASAYVPIAGATAVVTLIGGVLVDRISMRFALASALLLQASSLWLAQFLSAVWLALLYGALLGASMGLFHVVGSVAWAKYFGRLHLGSISGTAATIVIFGAALGPIPMGVARDLLGSYNQALSLLALLPLALGIAALFLSPPQRDSASV